MQLNSQILCIFVGLYTVLGAIFSLILDKSLQMIYHINADDVCFVMVPHSYTFKITKNYLSMTNLPHPPFFKPCFFTRTLITLKARNFLLLPQFFCTTGSFMKLNMSTFKIWSQTFSGGGVQRTQFFCETAPRLSRFFSLTWGLQFSTFIELLFSHQCDLNE